MENLTNPDTHTKHLVELEAISKSGKLVELITNYAKIAANATLEVVNSELDDTASPSNKLYWEAMCETAMANMKWLLWKRTNDVERAAKAANAKQ